MKMKKVSAVLLSFIFLLFSTNTVLAAPTIEAQPKSFFIQGSAGKTIRETVVIKNLADSLKVLSLEWQGYNLPSEEFTSESNVKNHSIDFAQLSTNSLELQPYGLSSVEVEFAVP